MFYSVIGIVFCLSAVGAGVIDGRFDDMNDGNSGTGVVNFTTVAPDQLPDDNETMPISSHAGNYEFRMEFLSFEKGLKSYIDIIRRNQLATLTDTVRFQEEIVKYTSRLYLNVSQTTTVKYRETCVCDDVEFSPCPEKCLYSCYRQHPHGYLENLNDCRDTPRRGCRCSSSSNTNCVDSMHNCFDEKTVNQYANDTICSEHAIDENKIIKSFELFTTLLVEKLRVFYRRTESKLTLIRQSAVSIDKLSGIEKIICVNQTEPACTNEVVQLLNDGKNKIRMLKRSIAIEVIKAQDQIDDVAKSVDNVREQTIAQINTSMKKYACCLKSLNFTVDGYDCQPPITELPATTTVKPFVSKYDSTCPPTVSFLCNNRKCIPRSLICDGEDDCGDFSDELVCNTGSDDD